MIRRTAKRIKEKLTTLTTKTTNPLEVNKMISKNTKVPGITRLTKEELGPEAATISRQVAEKKESKEDLDWTSLDSFEDDMPSTWDASGTNWTVTSEGTEPTKETRRKARPSETIREEIADVDSKIASAANMQRNLEAKFHDFLRTQGPVVGFENLFSNKNLKGSKVNLRFRALETLTQKREELREELIRAMRSEAVESFCNASGVSLEKEDWQKNGAVTVWVD